jgi:hypothetical protein
MEDIHLMFHLNKFLLDKIHIFQYLSFYTFHLNKNEMIKINILLDNTNGLHDPQGNSDGGGGETPCIQILG